MSAYYVPPHVRRETFTYADGTTTTVYRAPWESEGPLVRVEGGARVLWYMYASYVFRWPEGTTQLSVGHGSIDKHMGLFDNITITGRWHPGTLAEFAQAWSAEQFRSAALSATARIVRKRAGC